MHYKRGVVVVHNETTDAIEEGFTWGAQIVMGELFEPLCTSGVDGNHSTDPESGHYQARALDFGLRGFQPALGRLIEVPIPESKWEEVVKYTQTRLNDRYQAGRYVVLLEVGHFHVQRNKNTF